MKATLLSFMVVAALSPSGVALPATAKDYQFTGPVLEVTDSMIAVKKGSDRWEIAKDSNTKSFGDVKVGDEVTVHYMMTATEIDTTAAAEDDNKAPKKEAGDLTREEQVLVDKGATMQMYKPTEHTRHFVAEIDGKKGSKISVLCFVFGIEDAEPAHEEGKSMAESHYPRAEADRFLFARAWDKYQDRFFTRCYVQEGLQAYDNATVSTRRKK